MLDRFQRIRAEFGNGAFARLMLLLVGLLGMSILGFVFFGSLSALTLALTGFGAGWLLRRVIVDNGERLLWALPTGLFVYGVVLFLGERVLGLPGEAQLLIITATTVIMFDIQFWLLSDPSFVNIDRNDP